MVDTAIIVSAITQWGKYFLVEVFDKDTYDMIVQRIAQELKLEAKTQAFRDSWVHYCLPPNSYAVTWKDDSSEQTKLCSSCGLTLSMCTCEGERGRRSPGASSYVDRARESEDYPGAPDYEGGETQLQYEKRPSDLDSETREIRRDIFHDITKYSIIHHENPTDLSIMAPRALGRSESKRREYPLYKTRIRSMTKKMVETTQGIRRLPGTCCPEPECDHELETVICSSCGADCSKCSRGQLWDIWLFWLYEFDSPKCEKCELDGQCDEDCLVNYDSGFVYLSMIYANMEV